jgi:hypothetical protein
MPKGSLVKPASAKVGTHVRSLWNTEQETRSLFDSSHSAGLMFVIN